MYSSNTNSLLASNSLTFLGKLSYVIYLIHYPLKYAITNSFTDYYIFLVSLSLFLHYIIEYPFYKGSLIASNRQTYILSIMIIIFTNVLLNRLNRTIEKNSYNIKKYSSFQLIKEVQHNLRMYCCINNKSFIHTSFILFIGDSHIEQYIIALFYTKYNYKVQLIHLYVNSLSYNNYISKLIIGYIEEYSNNILCILIGNFIKQRKSVYNSIIAIANSVSTIHKNIILSNDNPYHNTDPNSCFISDKKKCFGIINKTCYIPRKFDKNELNINIKTVTLWNDNIIEEKKCFYYNKQYPIYADDNHFSLVYLKALRENILKEMISNITRLYKFKYDSKCKYYHLPSMKYNFPNLDNEKCVL